MTYQAVLYPQMPSPWLVPAAPQAAAHVAGGAPAAATWPAANRAIYIPVSLPVNAYLSGMSCWCAVTNSANADLGLYDAAGVRLGSMGSTALTVGINTWTPTNPILMQAGLTYYAAMGAVSASSTFLRWTNTAVALRAGGYAQQASAVALPSTATFAQIASAYLPLITLTFRGVPT